MKRGRREEVKARKGRTEGGNKRNEWRENRKKDGVKI